MLDNPYEDKAIKYTKINDTKTKIHTSLLKIYNHTPIENITIKDICNDALIARTTFYYYYNNIREVLDEIENNFLYLLLEYSGHLVEYYHNQDSRYDNDLKKTLDFFNSQMSLMKILLINNPDQLFIKRWEKNFMYNFYQCSHNELNLWLVSSICLTCYKYYLIHDIVPNIDNADRLVKYVHYSLLENDNLLHNVQICS